MPEASEVVMPRLSDSMEEGTILTWMKSVGDEIAVGDELVEIETDKANMVYEADAAGTLIEITAEEGATLAIGEVIARVGEAGESPAGRSDPAAAEAPAANGALAEHAGEATSEPATTPSATPPSPAPSNGAGDGRPKASPLARRIARERGIELGSVSGSGPGGRITKTDVEAALASGSASTAVASPLTPGGSGAASSPAQAGITSSLTREKPPSAPDRSAPAGTARAAEPSETAKGSVETVELTKLQQTVARRMAESKATVPHIYLTAEIDMSRCVAARAQIKQAAPEGEVVPSFNDMVVKACALALREHPRANGAYRDGALELHSRVNVGVAVAAPDALVVPTIFDADAKGLREIASTSRELAAKVRDRTITPPELSGGTFTVSNLGMYGIRSFGAVINLRQAAILTVGEISERPVVLDGELTAAQLMDVTLACDHRILYGADGVQFLGRVRALLEEPLGLAS